MYRAYVLIGKLAYPLLLPLVRPFIGRTRRVYVALFYKKQVIYVKNWLARDTWRLPGGGIGTGETPAAAAVREIKEELGIDIMENGLRKLYSGRYVTDNLGFDMTIFAFRLDTAPRPSLSKREITDYLLSSKLPEQMSDQLRSIVLTAIRQRIID